MKPLQTALKIQNNYNYHGFWGLELSKKASEQKKLIQKNIYSLYENTGNPHNLHIKISVNPKARRIPEHLNKHCDTVLLANFQKVDV